MKRTLGLGLCEYSSISVSAAIALAQIIYNMTHITKNKDIYLDNIGLDGETSDALASVASGVELSGTSYIDTTFTTSLWIYDYIDNSWHIETVSPFRIELRTIGHYFKLNVAYDANDITLLNANPELVLRMINGDTNTGLSFGIDDVEYMQPAKKSEGYVYQVPYLNSVQDGSFSSGNLDEWTATNAFISIEDGKLKVEDNGTYSSANFAFLATAGERVHISFKVRATGDGSFIYGVATNTSAAAFNVYYNPNTNIPTESKITYSFVPTSTGTYYLRLGQYGQTGLISYYDDVIVTTDLDLISNHVGETAYTNADLQNRGIPLTMFKDDDLGRITALSDANTLEFNGDGRYVNALELGGIASTDALSFEYIFTASGIQQASGSASTNNRFYMGEYNGNIIVGYGDGYYTLGAPVIGDIYHILLNCLGDGTCDIYINNVFIVQASSVSFTANLNFYIGRLSTTSGWNAITPIGRISKGDFFTESERNTNYQTAKTLYSTLP